MQAKKRLERDFFERNTVEVARDLLGKRLVRLEGGRRLAGIINETEAYRGMEDLGCHAKAGITPRTSVMFGQAGMTYVYFTYGMHWLLNFVTEPQGTGAAVLIRGMLVVEGLGVVAARRSKQPVERWTDGPGKITRALAIEGSLNNHDACTPQSVIWVEDGETIPPENVTSGPRVGLYTVPEPWKSIPWRFLARLPGEKEQLEELRRAAIKTIQ